MRAILETEIDRLMGKGDGAQAAVLPALRDPHAAVRRAMLALPGLVASIDALASAGRGEVADTARLAAAAEGIAAGVRGYARRAFKPLSGPTPDIGEDIGADEL